MTFDELFPATIEAIRRLTPFAGTFPILDQEAATFNSDYNTAIQRPGAALVLVYDEGTGDPDVRRIDLVNTVLVCVVVNPAVYTAATARELALALLRGLHHATRATEAPTRHQFTHAPQAISRGPMDSGLGIYYVTLRIKTVDTLTS